MHEDERDPYRDLFQTVLQFLARHPGDHSVRSGLTTLLSVEACGDMGIPLMALTMLDLAQQGARLVQPSANVDEDRSLEPHEAIQTSIKNGFTRLEEIGGGEPGVTVIPRDLLVADPDDVVRILGRTVDLASGQNGEDVDLESMKNLVLLACTICPSCRAGT